MQNDFNLQFIQQKLHRLKSAVMYSMSNSQQKLPNDIVTFLEADDAGHLWVIAHKPRWSQFVYEQRFPVRFVFYQKGVEYYIETSGTAVLAGKDEVVQYRGELGEGALLLKMTPSMIEYTDTSRKPAFPALSKFYTNVSTLFANLFFINSTNTIFSKLGKPKGFSKA